MTPTPRDAPAFVHRRRPDRAVDQPPPPGQDVIVMAALAIGIVLLGIQLWLLTVSLDLYLAGQGGQIWGLALVSAAIFLGGFFMTRLLGRRPGTPRREGGRRSGLSGLR